MDVCEGKGCKGLVDMEYNFMHFCVAGLWRYVIALTTTVFQDNEVW